jgi:hypothetical protein
MMSDVLYLWDGYLAHPRKVYVHGNPPHGVETLRCLDNQTTLGKGESSPSGNAGG